MEGGIAPVETNRTKGVDNSGLVNLQRQIMRGVWLPFCNVGVKFTWILFIFLASFYCRKINLVPATC